MPTDQGLRMSEYLRLLDIGRFREPLAAEQRWGCFWCGGRLVDSPPPHMDHICPLVRSLWKRAPAGGRTEIGRSCVYDDSCACDSGSQTWSNMQVLCAGCNRDKRSKPMSEAPALVGVEVPASGWNRTTLLQHFRLMPGFGWSIPRLEQIARREAARRGHGSSRVYVWLDKAHHVELELLAALQVRSVDDILAEHLEVILA